MAFNVRVSLPVYRPPVFPERCVVCGVAHPDDWARIRTRSIGWWVVLFPSLSEEFAIRAPACRDCAEGLARGLRMRQIVTTCIVLAGLTASVVLAGHLGARAWHAFLVGVVTLAFGVRMVWQWVFPAPLDLTAYETTVDYRFRDRPYAEEFAAMNGVPIKPAQAWLK